MNLQIAHAFKSYGGREVLRDFTLQFPESGVFCLFGPSGCGKTTLVNCLAGLAQLDTGCVTGIEGRRVSCVFQEDRLLPWASAEENIAAVFHDRKEGLRQAAEWLRKVGLEGEEKKKPREMSGGMCRRVALARALAYGGDIFLLDEPFQRLDEKNREKMMELTLKAVQGKLAVFITHNSAEKEKMADVSYILDGTPLKIVETAEKSCRKIG
jgi:NitT/TauT family transport system ATP-binding protein